MNSTQSCAITTLLLVGLLVLTEARYYGDDSPRHRHRHRHEVSSVTTRRNHERLAKVSPSWSPDYDAFEDDEGYDKKEDEEDDDEEDEYYRPRHYQPRLEPHRGRYHANTRHEVNFRHVEEAERRRRFGSLRGHRTRPYREEYTSRNHDDDDLDDIDYDDYERRHDDDDRRYPYISHRRDSYRDRPDRRDSYRDWSDRKDWRRRPEDRRRKNYQREGKRWFDYDYDDDERGGGGDDDVLYKERIPSFKKKNVSEISADDEEESIWKEAEADDDDAAVTAAAADDDDDGIDNDFFHDEPYSKTHDVRLTSNDPTPKASVKRDYRNIDEKYLKRDTYGNLKYYPSKNATHASTAIGARVNRKESMGNIKYLIAPSQKPSVFNLDNHRIEAKKLNSKISEPRAKIKNLDQDDEDYSDDRQSDVQSDVTIGEDAAEDENAAENETSAPITSSPITTITTTPRPVITTQQAYDRRDSRLFSTTTPHNGLQSIHFSHKVQAKESKSQVQNSKSGKSAEIREALQHALKVSREGSCQWPRARVIPVRDVYPSPSTTYIPHCAILHRCSDDTGCCRSEALTCVPKQSQKVELYFYTTSIGGGSVVEKLSFYNHTECECKEKREYGITSDSRPSSVQETEHRSYPSRQQHQSAMPPQNIRRPPQKKPCRCPSEFTPRITIDGECQCHCFEEDQDCIRVRRGKGYFSLRDRLCIQNEDCAVPLCEFGEYIRRQGRCPRKKDKFNEIANYQTHNLNHRRHTYRS